MSVLTRQHLERIPGLGPAWERTEDILSRAFENDRVLAALTIGPATLLMLIAAVIPVIWAFWLSLHEVNALNPQWHWTGLENYRVMLNTKQFWASFLRSFVFGFGSVALQLVVGLAVALMLSRQFRGVAVARALLFLPYLIPTIVVGMVFKLMLNGQFGIINVILEQLGLIAERKAWLGQANLAMKTLIVVNSWKFSIFITLMILARLQSIPDQFYEAATMNGAGPLRKFRDVTLPQIKGVILLVVLLRGIWMFNKFDIIWIMTDGGPGFQTTTLPVYIFRVAFLQFKLGQAGSIAGALFGFLGLGALVYFWAFNPADEVATA